MRSSIADTAGPIVTRLHGDSLAAGVTALLVATGADVERHDPERGASARQPLQPHV
jgi:hypothetical protein